MHDELAICALHVHVEIPDREQAVLAGNHLRPWLPTLIALGANSPFWAERDTGYASWRTMIWTRWPVAGPPPFFSSAEHYDRTVEMLHEVGSVVDVGTIFWDLRPSAHVPTLEVRVSDVPMTARDSVMTAALIRALTVDALAKVAAGDPGPQVGAEVLRLAYWRAARDGLTGSGIDPVTGRLVPAAALVESLVAVARPALEDGGEADAVASWLKELIHGGDGAARQRAAAADRGSLGDVVDVLIEQTAGAH
ncbi:YbdK family carboxylate-amine ligase [Catenulispora yoronensis]